MALLSFLLHALFVLLILWLASHVIPPVQAPIPVKLVMQPPATKPPPPKPPEQQQKEQQKQQEQKKAEEQKKSPPPPGRLASDDLGDTTAKDKAPSDTRGAAAGKPADRPGEAPPPPAPSPATPKAADMARPKPVDKPSDSAAPEQDQPKQTPEQSAKSGTLAAPSSAFKMTDAAKLATKSKVKPNPDAQEAEPGGARKANERPDDPAHAEGHAAKVPGPDATRDEYLAYLNSLIHQHVMLLSRAAVGNRSGHVELDIHIRHNGTILWVTVLKSSGIPDIDQRAVQMVEAVGRFPPVPKYFSDPGTLGLTFYAPFPSR